MSQNAGQYTLIGTSVLLLAAIAWAMKNLAAGRFAYAVGSEAEAARARGNSYPRITTFGIFILMGALAGLAAMMNVVQSPQVDPKSGYGLELRAIAAAVVGGVAVSGGRGNLWGVFAGLLLPGLHQSGAHVSPTSRRIGKKAIQGAIILLAVVADGWRSRKQR
jgi:rhamnose transport system permease protein